MRIKLTNTRVMQGWTPTWHTTHMTPAIAESTNASPGALAVERSVHRPSWHDARIHWLLRFQWLHLQGRRSSNSSRGAQLAQAEHTADAALMWEFVQKWWMAKPWFCFGTQKGWSVEIGNIFGMSYRQTVWNAFSGRGILSIPAGKLVMINRKIIYKSVRLSLYNNQ